MNLNIGSGSKIFSGWLNIDIDDMETWLTLNKGGQGAQYFRRVNAIDFLKASTDSCVENISMIHFLDHFVPRHALWMLEQCKRVLAPGGVLRVEVEDLGVIISAWEDNKLSQWTGHQPVMYADFPPDMQVAVLMFGNLADNEEYTGHKMIYTEESLGWMLGRAGFESEKITIVTAGQSAISGWQAEWDTQPSHSVIMEAQR